MSPLSLVTHGNSNRLMAAPQLPNIVPLEIEQRMLEYIKLFQTPKDIKSEKSLEKNHLFFKINQMRIEFLSVMQLY